MTVGAVIENRGVLGHGADKSVGSALKSEKLSTKFDTIVVVGGGCYGSYYVQQLSRARAAGAVEYRRILVPDMNPECQVAQRTTLAEEGVELVVADWGAFFSDYLGASSLDSTDAIVPSPLMPHLMYQWLLERAKLRWPKRVVETAPLNDEMALPWQTMAPDGTRYGSFATWMCPINCIEPKKCPHTRSERTWTMPVAAAGEVEKSDMLGPVIFHCTHRAYGVGMFETRDVLLGDAFVASAGEAGAANILVGTVSHCHGAFNMLHIE